MLSEEAEQDPARLAAARVWIIDPLDGTREFAEIDPDGTRRTDFAVHVALWAAGRRPRGRCRRPPGPRPRPRQRHRGARPRGRGAREVLAGARPLRIAASRTRPPAIVGRLAARGDVELLPMGSSGVKVMAVIEGTADAYVHAGGQ